jgi:hypothetical protein
MRLDANKCLRDDDSDWRALPYLHSLPHWNPLVFNIIPRSVETTVPTVRRVTAYYPQQDASYTGWYSDLRGGRFRRI